MQIIKLFFIIITGAALLGGCASQSSVVDRINAKYRCYDSCANSCGNDGERGMTSANVKYGLNWSECNKNCSAAQCDHRFN